MSTPKKLKNTTKTTTTTPITADSKPAVIIAHLKAKYALSANDIEAFDALITDAKRSELGKKTKASNVLDNGCRWAVEIDKQLALYPAALADYTPERFAYFLNRLDRLERRLNAGAKSVAQVVESRLGEDGARKAAILARGELLSRMTRFAGQRDTERGEIAAQQGVSEGDGLRTSLIGLCDLVEKWLGRKDGINVRLLDHAGLSEERVDAARKAASALGSAGGKAALEGSKVVRDAPLVNLDEGGVLFEMSDVMEVFDGAAERTNVVQRLRPNESVRHAFFRPTGKKAAGITETPAPPPPPPPPAGPVPPANNGTTQPQKA